MNKKTVTAIKWISLASVASVAIWQFALFVSNMLNTSQAVARIGFGLIVSLLAILLVTVLCRYGKSKSSLSFFSQAKEFLVGLGWYVVPSVLALAIASLFGVVEISVDTSLIDSVGAIALIAVLVFLSEALPEEIIFRGYIFSKLAVLSGRWMVIFFQAAIFLIFAFMIGALDSWLDASFIFTFGICLGILRAAFGSVAAPIGFHLACMTMQQSFSSQWSPFTVADQTILQTFIFGMIPLSIVSAFFVTKMLNSKT